MLRRHHLPAGRRVSVTTKLRSSKAISGHPSRSGRSRRSNVRFRSLDRDPERDFAEHVRTHECQLLWTFRYTVDTWYVATVSTFTVQATLSNPEHVERAVTVELLVDTGATYTLLPAEVVAALQLATPYAQPAVLASGDEITYRVGEVRVRLGDEARVTVFWLGPRGSRALLGAVTLEQFGLAADPVNRRLIRVPGLLV